MPISGTLHLSPRKLAHVAHKSVVEYQQPGPNIVDGCGRLKARAAAICLLWLTLTAAAPCLS